MALSEKDGNRWRQAGPQCPREVGQSSVTLTRSLPALGFCVIEKTCVLALHLLPFRLWVSLIVVL